MEASGSSRSFWPFVAALGLGVSAVGYCLYFDQKRRNAPDFKEKLRAKRQKQKQVVKKSQDSFPVDPTDQEAMRIFFLEQVQKGEDCLSRGDFDGSVDHFTKAVVVCSQPHSLLGLLQQSLPAEVFQEIRARLPQVLQSFAASTQAAVPSFSEPELE